MDEPQEVVDFFRRREEWQWEQTRRFNRLLKRLCRYAERETNLREKVRARHVFSTIMGNDSFPEETPHWEDWFRLWYALDYHNIRGLRHLDGYLHKYHTELTDKELQMIASLMTSYLSSYGSMKRAAVGWLVNFLETMMPVTGCWGSAGWRKAQRCIYCVRSR